MIALAQSDPAERPTPRRADVPVRDQTPAASDIETRRVIDLLRRTLDRLPE